MKRIALIIVLCLIIFGLGYFYAVKTAKPDIIETITTNTDTLYVKSPPELIYKTATITKILIDTTIITETDTIIIKDTIRIAKADTSFKEGKLKTEYYFPPANYFKFNWQPYPQSVITITNNIVIKPRWYQRKELWGATGLMIGILITK